MQTARCHRMAGRFPPSSIMSTMVWSHVALAVQKGLQSSWDSRVLNVRARGGLFQGGTTLEVLCYVHAVLMQQYPTIGK